MKLSVLMVTYNHERFIARAIESVLTQETSFDVELVIGEDCSTDGTREIVKAYAHRNPGRIRVLERSTNLGGRRNFVDTYFACTGEYIALLDGDDYWTDSRKLQKQVDALEKNRDWSLCFHTVRLFHDDGSVPAYNFPIGFDRSVSTVDDLLRSNFIQPCTLVVRAGLVERFPEWFFLPGPGDWPFCILHALHGDIGYLPEVMADYRVHGGGRWTAKDRVVALMEEVALFRAMTTHLHKHRRRLARATASNLQLEAAVVHSERGEFFRGLACVARSLLGHPLGPETLSRWRCAMLCRAALPRLFRWITKSAGKSSLPEKDSDPTPLGDVLTSSQQVGHEKSGMVEKHRIVS